MKKFLALLALLCATSLYAQIDIPNNQIGPNKILATNVTWSGSGVSGINNNYVLTPTNTTEGLCLYITNNDTSLHSYALQFFSTGDQSVNTFTNNTGKWTLIGPSNSTVTQNAASATSSYFIQAQGASRLVVSISGGSGASTATVTLVESPNGFGCGNIPSSAVYCPILQSVNATTGITQLLAQATNQAVYVCSLSILFSAAPAAGDIILIEGTGASCGTGTSTVFDLPVSATTPFYASFTGIPLVPRFFASGTDFVGRALCINNTQATTARVNITMAQF